MFKQHTKLFNHILPKLHSIKFPSFLSNSIRNQYTTTIVHNFSCYQTCRYYHIPLNSLTNDHFLSPNIPTNEYNEINFEDEKQNSELLNIQRKIHELTEILELNPESINTLFERSECYGSIGEWKLGCLDLENIIQMNPPISNSEMFSLVYRRLYFYNVEADNYNIKKAAEYLEKAYQLDMNRDPFQNYFQDYLSLYSLYYEMNLFERAVTIVTEGIKTIEGSGPVESGSKEADELAQLLCRRGNVLIRKFNMMENGRKDLERALSLSSSKYEPLLLMLEAFSTKDNHELMLQTYELVKKFEKEEENKNDQTILEYSKLHESMARYYTSIDDFQTAWECLKLCTLTHPDVFILIHGLYAHLSLRFGDYSKFIQCTKIHIELAGDLSAQIAEHDLSEADIDQKLEFVAAASALYFHLGKFDAAIKECEKLRVLLEVPQDFFPKKHLLGIYNIISAYSHAKNGNDQLAVEFAMEAKQVFPIILRILADFYHQQGKYEIAKSFYLSSYKESQNLHDLGNMAGTFISEKDYSRAIKESEKILEINPNHAFALFNLGECYFYLQDLEKAEKYFDRAMENVSLTVTRDDMVNALQRFWPKYLER